MVRRKHAASISACARLCLEPGELAFSLAQFTLQSQRAFAGRLAAGHGRVVEALTLAGEEKCVAVLSGEPLRFGWIFDQVAVLELGQDGFERSPKAIQHADRVLERE